MNGMPLLWLILIFVATSAVSVVTGSTSLITVPAMLQFHIEPVRACNQYVRTHVYERRWRISISTRPGRQSEETSPIISLTLAGSIIGAFLLLLIPTRSVPVIVSAAMIGIAIFSLVYRKSGMQDVSVIPSESAEFTGYALTFLLGIYGGFFSGGYVTILTAVYVTVFRLSFLEAIATTKLMNVFSSAVATTVFMLHGLANYRLGVILGVAMFGGAVLGARFAIRLGNLWLRRIFLTAVWVLGLKALVFDFLANVSGCGDAPSHAEQ